MRNQGNIKMTLLTLMPSFILLAFAIFSIQKIDEYPYSLFSYGLLAFSVVLVIFGIIFLIRCFVNLRVQNKGKNSVCTVIGYSKSRNRYTSWNFLRVEYEGESGKVHHNKVEVSLNTISRCPVGTKISCKVLGEDCFVNGDWINIIKDSD